MTIVAITVVVLLVVLLVASVFRPPGKPCCNGTRGCVKEWAHPWWACEWRGY